MLNSLIRDERWNVPRCVGLTLLPGWTAWHKAQQVIEKDLKKKLKMFNSKVLKM